MTTGHNYDLTGNPEADLDYQHHLSKLQSMAVMRPCVNNMELVAWVAKLGGNGFPLYEESTFVI